MIMKIDDMDDDPPDSPSREQNDSCTYESDFEQDEEKLSYQSDFESEGDGSTTNEFIEHETVVEVSSSLTNEAEAATDDDPITILINRIRRKHNSDIRQRTIRRKIPPRAGIEALTRFLKQNKSKRPIVSSPNHSNQPRIVSSSTNSTFLESLPLPWQRLRAENALARMKQFKKSFQVDDRKKIYYASDWIGEKMALLQDKLDLARYTRDCS